MIDTGCEFRAEEGDGPCGQPAYGGRDSTGSRCPLHGGPTPPPRPSVVNVTAQMNTLRAGDFTSVEGLARIDMCAELLPPPGAEVVHAATAEIRRLRGLVDVERPEDSAGLPLPPGVHRAFLVAGLSHWKRCACSLGADHTLGADHMAPSSVESVLATGVPMAERLAGVEVPASEEFVRAALEEIERLRAPIPLVLFCPMCRVRHIDKGAFATKPHHTHSCQGCGFTWRPAVVATVGVQYLPGFKDEPEVCAGGTCTFTVGLGACGRVAFGVGEGTTWPRCHEHGGPRGAVDSPIGEGTCVFIVHYDKTRGVLCGGMAWGGTDSTGNRCPMHGGPPPPPGAVP